MARIATALICLAATTCGGVSLAQSAAGPESPPSVSEFELSYIRSGGLRPSPQSLWVEPGRHATAMQSKVGTHGGSSRSTQFRIGREQVKRLRAALERARFLKLVSPEPGADGCADCYLYSIKYRQHRVQFSEATLPKKLRPVVSRMEAVIAHHLPFH